MWEQQHSDPLVNCITVGCVLKLFSKGRYEYQVCCVEFSLLESRLKFFNELGDNRRCVPIKVLRPLPRLVRLMIKGFYEIVRYELDNGGSLSVVSSFLAISTSLSASTVFVTMEHSDGLFESEPFGDNDLFILLLFHVLRLFLDIHVLRKDSKSDSFDNGVDDGILAILRSDL